MANLVILTSSSTKGFNFSVYDKDIEEKEKYLGTISHDQKNDSCTCMGNTMGKLCKHIKTAQKMMEGYW